MVEIKKYNNLADMVLSTDREDKIANVIIKMGNALHSNLSEAEGDDWIRSKMEEVIEYFDKNITTKPALESEVQNLIDQWVNSQEQLIKARVAKQEAILAAIDAEEADVAGSE